jgi:hypothetical protein
VGEGAGGEDGGVNAATRKPARVDKASPFKREPESLAPEQTGQEVRPATPAAPTVAAKSPAARDPEPEPVEVEPEVDAVADILAAVEAKLARRARYVSFSTRVPEAFVALLEEAAMRTGKSKQDLVEEALRAQLRKVLKRKV